MIDKISAQCHKLIFSGMSAPNYYKRISAPNKINLNQLDMYKEKIETMILRLGLIEDIIATVNSDFDYSDKFERVISFIMEKYEDLRNKYEGIALYDKVVESIVNACDNTESLMIPCEMLLVYVFDKCDIFEKE